VPPDSLRNRYKAKQTGLPSLGNEVARLPRGDIREEKGISRGAQRRFGRGLNLFVGSGGSLLMPWLVLRFPLCHPTRAMGSSAPLDHIPGWFHPCARSNHVVHPSARGHHGNTPPVLCNLSPVHAPYLSGPRVVAREQKREREREREVE